MAFRLIQAEDRRQPYFGLNALFEMAQQHRLAGC
jgi:hypothetical protein